MDVKKVAKRYKETNYSTLTMVEYVLLLLNECLRHVQHCETAIQSADRESLYDASTKSQQLLFELMATTDRRTAEGERLMTIYAYLNQCLVAVRLHKKLEILNGVADNLQEMIESWETAKQKSRRQNYTSDWI